MMCWSQLPPAPEIWFFNHWKPEINSRFQEVCSVDSIQSKWLTSHLKSLLLPSTSFWEGRKLTSYLLISCINEWIREWMSIWIAFKLIGLRNNFCLLGFYWLGFRKHFILMWLKWFLFDSDFVAVYIVGCTFSVVLPLRKGDFLTLRDLYPATVWCMRCWFRLRK